MSFSIVYRVVLTDRTASDAIIAAGSHDWLCQDWGCPSHSFCARHFGLSERYAAMAAQKASEALVCPTRKGDLCDHYRQAERDYFSESCGELRVFPNVRMVGRA